MIGLTPMTNDEILAGLIMAAKAEREAGFPGWSRPPDTYRDQCEALVAEGLAERHDDEDGIWYRPTSQGEKTCSIKISRVQ